MRILVTGGAGFIGSHLAEALLAARPRSLRARRFVDRVDRQHLASQGPAGVSLHDRHGVQRLARRRARRSRGRHLSSRGGGRRQADRAGARAHDRDQRSRDRGDPAPRGEEEKTRLHRLDVRGLRQEHRRSVSRRRRSRDGRNHADTAGRTPAAKRSTSSSPSPTGKRRNCRRSSAASSTPLARGRPDDTGWSCRRSCGRRWPESR